MSTAATLVDEVATPSWHNFAMLIGGILIVTVLSFIFKKDPLRDVPGPWLNKYTSLPLALHTRTGKRYLYVHELHKKYGSFVRITPHQVSCFTPDASSKVYAQGSASLPKTGLYRAFYIQGTPSLFSTQDRAGHASKRRALSHPFSYASVRQFEEWIRGSMIKLLRGLDGYAVGIQEGAEVPGRASGRTGEIAEEDGQYVDILAWFNYLTFDVISDLAFGQPLGMLDRGTDVILEDDTMVMKRRKKKTGVAAMIDYRGRTAAFLGLFPAILPPTPLSSLIMWFLREVVPDEFIRRGLSSTESLSVIAQKCVRRRLAEGASSVRGDLLDRLVEGMRKKQADGDMSFGEEDVITEAMLLLTAGSDTTANSSAAILYHIIKHPDVHRKLLEELEQNIPAEDEDIPLPTHDQVKNLPYLQATIDEGLRMFATNAFGLPRVVPTGSTVEFKDKYGDKDWVFREGTELSVPAYSIQHDPKIWGKDVDSFVPSRWLQPNTTTNNKETDLKKYLLTFGMGPRACIGKNLAYMQMQLLIAAVVLRYDLELRDEEMRSVEGFMHKPVDLWVRIRVRDVKARVGKEGRGQV